MNTLRGIFPDPKMPPKRDFVKENVKKLQELQKIKNSMKNLNVGSTPRSRLQQRTKLSENNKKQHNRGQSQSVKSTLSSNALRKSASLTSIVSTTACTSSSSTSKLKDAASQTTDVNDELFYKDVIIRLPSASVLEKLKKPKSDLFLNANANNENDINKTDSLPLSSKLLNIKTNLSEKELYDLNMNLGHNSNLYQSLSSNNINFESDYKDNISDTISTVITNNLNNNYLNNNNLNHAYNNNNMNNNSDNNKINNNKINYTIKKNNNLNNNNINNNINNNDDNISEKNNNIQLNTEVSKMDLPQSYRVGELPKYLKMLKEKNILQTKRDALIDRNCPSGHMPLSDEDRLQALAIAERNSQELIDELNRMPMSSQTLKRKFRKAEIEKELSQLDDNIRIFSKLKVYVKLDQ